MHNQDHSLRSLPLALLVGSLELHLAPGGLQVRPRQHYNCAAAGGNRIMNLVRNHGPYLPITTMYETPVLMLSRIIWGF